MDRHDDRGNGANLVQILCSMGIDIRSPRFSEQIGGVLDDLRAKEGDDRLTPHEKRVRAFLETFGDSPQAVRFKALELSAQLGDQERPALQAALIDLARTRFPTDQRLRDGKVSELVSWTLPKG